MTTRRTRSPRDRRARDRAVRTIEKLERKIPYYDLFAEDGLDLIEEHADRILAEVGIEVWGDDVTLDLFHDAGATIDGQRMRFDPGLVKDIVTRSTPREFVQHARDPERSVTIGGDHTVFAPGYGMPFVRDLDDGRRYGTMADFERLVKINQTLEYTHHSGHVICEPTDVPVNKRHLDMLATQFRYGSKPLLGAITAPERALDSIEMSRLVFGDGYLDDHCVIMGNINVNSPLVFDGQVTEVVRHYAAANQGMVICPFILGGAMGPVTPAGAVAQAHAEAMVGVALTQLVRPGAPAIYGNFLTTMSLRSGAPTFGTPEAGLAYFAVGQLARRLGVPVRCGGAYTSAKLPDAQAAQESANSMLTAMMSGANFVLHAAGWLEGGLVMDYEKLVLDNDRLGMLHVMLRGMPLDDNAFAMDGFHEVGPGSHFLGSAHTLANYETAYYESPFGDSMSWEQWREEGELDARQRANADWKSRLANYEQPPLPAGVDEALDEFVAKKKDAVPDAWY
jgi:trimethylamine--corrinoid protein Co-methyltransferase